MNYNKFYNHYLYSVHPYNPLKGDTSSITGSVIYLYWVHAKDAKLKTRKEHKE